MPKLFRTSILIFISGVIIGSGLVAYRQVHNTPERAAQRFVQALTTKDGEAVAYRQLSPALLEKYRYNWHEVASPFTTTQGEPRLVSQEQVTDSFNTYTEQQDPQRLTYRFKMKDRDYQATLILIKEQGTWLVDELHGSYVDD